MTTGLLLRKFCTDENIHGSVLPEELRSGSAIKNRIAIDPDWFFDRDHGCDCSFKIGIRFHVPSAIAVPEPVFNRDVICI
jgi:hypothetical protein